MNNTNKENTMTTSKECEINNNTMYDCYIELEKAIGALDNFVNNYDYNVNPTPRGAIKYGTATNETRKECTLDDEVAFKILCEYQNMMWFIHVARDYCDNAIKPLRKEFE